MTESTSFRNMGLHALAGEGPFSALPKALVRPEPSWRPMARGAGVGRVARGSALMGSLLFLQLFTMFVMFVSSPRGVLRSCSEETGLVMFSATAGSCRACGRTDGTNSGALAESAPASPPPARCGTAPPMGLVGVDTSVSKAGASRPSMPPPAARRLRSSTQSSISPEAFCIAGPFQDQKWSAMPAGLVSAKPAPRCPPKNGLGDSGQA
mmetsp:Transcript_29576/g.91996  ORF Transcript_29576/g.91996 Transcript_29576/m.91996 type:complete len:209 (-) Transcript_29576:360-986(-)